MGAGTEGKTRRPLPTLQPRPRWDALVSGTQGRLQGEGRGSGAGGPSGGAPRESGLCSEGTSQAGDWPDLVLFGGPPKVCEEGIVWEMLRPALGAGRGGCRGRQQREEASGPERRAHVPGARQLGGRGLGGRSEAAASGGWELGLRLLGDSQQGQRLARSPGGCVFWVPCPRAVFEAPELDKTPRGQCGPAEGRLTSSSPRGSGPFTPHGKDTAPWPAICGGLRQSAPTALGFGVRPSAPRCPRTCLLASDPRCGNSRLPLTSPNE